MTLFYWSALRAKNATAFFGITTNSPSAGDIMNITYSYDNVGNITKIEDLLDSNKTRDYVYDDFDRLIEADSPSYGGNLVYQYDKIGNMTYNCRYGYYEYDSDHPHAVKRIVKNQQVIEQYEYDANGNMISGAGRTFTYDYDNMPTSISYNLAATISVYDAYGMRVKKVTPVSTTTYLGQIYECEDGECTKYVFAGIQRIATIKSTDTYYSHTDHLGSATVLTDSSSNVAQDIYYYPYGEIKTSTGTIDVRHKYTDKEWDAEAGLYYFGARYYDPKLAKFISADPIVPAPFYPQTLNRYSYAYNNPMVVRDLNGNCGFFGAIASFVSSVVSAVARTAVAVVGAVATGAKAAVGLAGRGFVALAKGAATVARITGGAIATVFRGGGNGGKGPDISGNKMYASNDEGQVWDDFFGDSSDSRQNEYQSDKPVKGEGELYAMASIKGAEKTLKVGKKAYKAAKTADTAKDVYDLATDPGPENPNKGLTPQEGRDTINQVTDSVSLFPFWNPVELKGGYLDRAIYGIGNYKQNQQDRIDKINIGE